MKGDLQMAENIVTGKSYKVLTDAASNSWDKVSFWTKASDVENNAGQTLQSTVGNIAGLSNNLVTTAGNYALDATQGKALNDKLGGLQFVEQDGSWGFIPPDGEFQAFTGGGLVQKTLWTNPNPASTFAGQTISVNTSGYDYVFIDTILRTTDTNIIRRNTIDISKTTGGITCANDNSTILAFRAITNITSSAITFGGGYYRTSSLYDNNNYCIPYQIIGVKKSSQTSVSEFNPDYTVFQFGSNSWGGTAGQSYNAPSDGYVKYMLCGAGSGTMQFLLDGTVKGSSTGRNLVSNIIQVSAGQQCQLRLASGAGAWAGAGAMTFYTL